jgi:hypothetical protein
MKQWFPFTDYDFYAYLTAGMLLIAAIDYTFAGAVLVQRTEWTVVQIAFWTAVAYLVGQLVAGPSAAVLEHGVARGLLHPPLAVCLGLRQRRRREKLAAALFANREYAPLPAQVRVRRPPWASRRPRSRTRKPSSAWPSPFRAASPTPFPAWTSFVTSTASAATSRSSA